MFFATSYSSACSTWSISAKYYCAVLQSPKAAAQRESGWRESDFHATHLRGNGDASYLVEFTKHQITRAASHLAIRARRCRCAGDLSTSASRAAAAPSPRRPRPSLVPARTLHRLASSDHFLPPLHALSLPLSVSSFPNPSFPHTALLSSTKASSRAPHARRRAQQAAASHRR